MKRESDSADLDRIAREAAAGGEAAFEALVRLVFPRVYRWALVGVGDPDDAEDVTQRVLVRLHARLASWEGRGQFTTWLYRITANEASSWRRRAARRLRNVAAAHDSELPVDSVGLQDLDRKRLVEEVRSHFLRLPRRQREIMDLVDFQGFSPSETAEMLGMNGNTVRANLFKARRALRERMLREHPDVQDQLR